MRTVCSILCVLLPTSLTFACGGNATGDAARAPKNANAEEFGYFVAEGQVRVLKLASPDGRVRIVLDRSGAKPKMLREGERDIVELTMVEERRSGDLTGHWLVDPTGSRRMFLDVRGGYTLLDGRDRLALRVDGPAPALGKSTVSGSPPPSPKSASERDAESLARITVRSKMPAMKSEDASRLVKIEEAIKAATPDMFVRYVVREQGGWEARLAVVPDSISGVAYGGVGHATEEKWAPDKSTGLRKYGGTVKGFTDYNAHGHMQVVTLDGYTRKGLASGTPGIIWEIDGTTAAFVTLDGARYTLSLGQPQVGLEPGAGSEKEWPSPLQHTLLDITEATALVKVGELAKSTETELFAQDDEWFACTRKVWKSVERKIDSYKFTEADRKDTVKRAEATCAAPVKKQEATFLNLVETRAKARAALYEVAKTRLRSLAQK